MARKYLLVDISQRGEYILHVYDKEIIDWLIELGKKQSEYKNAATISINNNFWFWNAKR